MYKLLYACTLLLTYSVNRTLQKEKAESSECMAAMDSYRTSYSYGDERPHMLLQCSGWKATACTCWLASVKHV